MAEGVAEVQGVLEYNEETRAEMLTRIDKLGKSYIEKGLPSLGSYVTIQTKEVKSPTEGRDLLEFTHDDTSDYSKTINTFYLTKDVNIESYESKPVEPQDYKRWSGNYKEKFSYDNKLTQVGDSKYIEGSSLNSMANKDRFLEQKYLTPQLFNFYGRDLLPEGQKPSGIYGVFNTIAGVYHYETGRIAEIAEANVPIIHDPIEALDNSNLNSHYLSEIVENGRKWLKYDFLKNKDKDENRYLNISDKEILEGIIKRFSYSDELNEGVILFDIFNKGNTNRYNSSKTYTIYDEDFDGNYEDSNGNIYNNLISLTSKKSLLNKTNELFKNHKIHTLIGRFHTDQSLGDEIEIIDSAKSKTFGNSHGRNLLKRKEIYNQNTTTNGYDNPYCRTWTYHSQYDRFSRLIRPFIKSDEKGENVFQSIKEVQEMNKLYRRQGGGEYLANNTVLQNNGLVNITPKKGVKDDLKKYMLSIENLAWKDFANNKNLTNEQIGPNGGRIMWFPPYDLDFQESINANWEANSFIGRGEQVYTYSNTERTGTLSFCILIDHPSIINSIQNKKGKGVEDDIDADILRFFAGCELFDNDENKKEEEKISKKENKVEEEKQLPSSTIKFKVYFPNNYSGFIKEATKEEVEKYKGNYTNYENIFWYYQLLLGRNAVYYPDSEENWRGYEVSLNEPITKEECSGETINSCENTTFWESCKKENPNFKYYYPVDFDLRQILKNKSNFKDSSSYGLNNKHDGEYYSFTEIICALEELDKENEIYNFFKRKLGSEEEREIFEKNVENLKKIFKDINIEKIDINGNATKQDEKNSNKLSLRRALCLKNYLIDTLSKDDNISSKINTSSLSHEVKDRSSVNDETAKKSRSAEIIIYYRNSSISSYSDSANGSTINEVSGETPSVEISENTNNLINTEEENSENTTNKVYTREDGTTITRYESEGEYFNKLEEKSPLIFQSLKDKFKIFDPAFHSMSPEGFNARLTFLQQCTRQGNTLETSRINSKVVTAENLAFGRMPVCILRIGDFIYSKIIINSITINYNDSSGMRFDLNPEGAGVQPMYAKISLQIRIIGGQTLQGPINKLQNALSFNYYSNSGVYDDRADRGQGNNMEYVWDPYDKEYTKK